MNSRPIRTPAFLLALLFLLGGILPSAPLQAADKPQKTPSNPGILHPSDPLFSGPILRFELETDRAGMESLRREPRQSVPATLRIGSNSWESVGIRVKGAAGSTRSIDDLPALTLNIDKFKKGQKFHGLEKIHLNNSVQDPSRMSEIVCADLYRRAGIPATRASHALVTLNGRNLGLYVLKEGFDKTFLRRHFNDPSGNLYDGGFLQDIDQELKLDSGKEPPDWKDLRSLANATQLRDPVQRQKGLEQWLEVDRFITYTALQVLTEDWDGYPANRNNYRLYHEPASGRFTFLPHGMDQMFDHGGMPLDRGFEGMVAQGVFQIRDWRQAYFDRISSLLTNIFTTETILPVFDAAVARREPALSLLRRGQAEQIRSATRNIRARIVHRVDNAREQMENRPQPVGIDAEGRIRLARWNPRQSEDGGLAERATGPEAKPELRLILRDGGQVSWRTRATLPPGRYRFEGMGQARNVDSSHDGTGSGLGLRISGSPRDNGLTGSTDWQPLAFEFALDSEAQVELVAELRGRRGTGAFDPSAFVLRQLR